MERDPNHWTVPASLVLVGMRLLWLWENGEVINKHPKEKRDDNIE